MASKAVPDTRARHALLALLDEQKQSEIEEKTGVAQPAISLIASQKRIPGRETIAKLAKVGIEFGWWMAPPTAAQLKRDEARKAKAAAKESAA